MVTAKQHKDWKEIATISNPRTMRALALLDTSTKFGQAVILFLSEYFSGADTGPIPISIIRRLGAYRKQYPGDDPAIYDRYWKKMGLDNALVIRFSTNEDVGIRGDFPILPDGIRQDIDDEVEIGDIFTWNGKRFVLMMDDRAKDICGLMYFAPAELFDINQ